MSLFVTKNVRSFSVTSNTELFNWVWCSKLVFVGAQASAITPDVVQTLERNLIV
jgi:hypothetical protein